MAEGKATVTVEVDARFAYPRVVRFINDHPWAIMPEKLEAIAEVLSHRLMHGPALRTMEDDDYGVTVRAAAAPPYVRIGAVAMLPVMGTISKRMNMFNEFSGGASIEKLQTGLRGALADPDVESILLQIDSPGGSIYGVQEFSDEIFAARANSGKRIVAIADDLAASAAYWLGSQAHELIVTP